MRAIVILAGGHSQRLKDSQLLGVPNKVLLPIGHRPNIERTLELCALTKHPTLVLHEGEAKATKGLSIEHAASFFSPDYDHFAIVLGDVVWQRSELFCLVNELLVGQCLYHGFNNFTAKPYEEFLGAVVSRRQLGDVAQCSDLRDLPKFGFTRHRSGGWSDDIDNEPDYRLRLPILRELALKEDACA